MTTKSMIRRPLLGLASCSILLHAACGDDSTEPDVGIVDPNYLVATGLLSPDGVSGLVFFLEGLGSDFEAEPELTRYDFRSDDQRPPTLDRIDGSFSGWCRADHRSDRRRLLQHRALPGRRQQRHRGSFGTRVLHQWGRSMIGPRRTRQA